MDQRSTQTGAIDWSHHLSKLALKRRESPLKGLQKYLGKPGLIQLAGGLPAPEYFPFDNVGGQALQPQALSHPGDNNENLHWFWKLFAHKQSSTVPITVPKFANSPGDLNLAVALQYGLATGLPQLQAIIQEFTAKVYKPAYPGFTTFVHTGNTDGWSKVVMTLCNPGEAVLTGEWTYPSALITMAPFDIVPAPVALDAEGIRADSLREVLSNWDVAERGRPRPHVMYTVPIGQNPTGATMGLKRKQAIYEVCVEFDVIIVEDDPYYFLQEGPYSHPGRRPARPMATDDGISDEEYIARLAPTFLAVDYQGRVIRLDTFSKTVAPGCRLGWFTCNSLFSERLQRQAETSTQAPCGFGQSLVTALLLQWQYTGYIKWLRGLGGAYTERRDFFLDCLMEKFNFDIVTKNEGALAGSLVYNAYEKREGAQEKTLEHALFSFIPPTAGMFVWFTVPFVHHQSYTSRDDEESLELQLFIALAEAGVLIGPGRIFDADPGREGHEERIGHLRMSFSNFEELKKGVDIFAKVITAFFRKL